jgi:hypothetical protein
VHHVMQPHTSEGRSISSSTKRQMKNFSSDSEGFITPRVFIVFPHPGGTQNASYDAATCYWRLT